MQQGRKRRRKRQSLAVRILCFAMILSTAAQGAEAAGALEESKYGWTEAGEEAKEMNNIKETEPKTEAKEGETSLEAQTSPTSDPESSGETEPQTKPPAESHPETEAPLETEPQTESFTETLPETDVPKETELETNPSTEAETEVPKETEPFTKPGEETELPKETSAQTEPLTDTGIETKLPIETQVQTEPKAETNPPAEHGTQTEALPEETATAKTPGEGNQETAPALEAKEDREEPTKAVREEESRPKQKKEGTVWPSETALGSSYWDESWYVTPDFRFSKVEKTYLLSEAETVNVYAAANETAEKVGILPFFSLAYILKDLENGWLFVESGEVRCFVREESMSERTYAKTTVEIIGEDAFLQGQPLMEKADNAAYTYTYTTVYEVLAPKRCGFSLYSEDILEYPALSSRVVGKTSSGTLTYILDDSGNGWVFVESGDVRGFVKKEALLCGETAEALLVSAGGESAARYAAESLTPRENRSLYFTLRSTKPVSRLGDTIASYALSYVGRLPYVWGGCSLTSGADCSGFTQAVYASFGIRIPRLAQDQGVCGEKVESLQEAKPGDLIYYASGPHVGIYLGDGKVVQCSGGSRNTAANPGKGPTVSPADYQSISGIRRYVIERETLTGSFADQTDSTSYTQEEMELIWAVVAQEDNGSYEGALAVISSAMNRTESRNWAFLGSNALAQLTAKGQYCYSMDAYWKPRLNGNVPDYVKQAVYDCLKKGIRNHPYTSFRSTKGSQTGSDAVQIGGNWFFGN